MHHHGLRISTLLQYRPQDGGAPIAEGYPTVIGEKHGEKAGDIIPLKYCGANPGAM